MYNQAFNLSVSANHNFRSKNKHHVSGEQNVTTDLLSRIEVVRAIPTIDFKLLADEKTCDPELIAILNRKMPSDLFLQKPPISGSTKALYTDCPGGIVRPYITKSFREQLLHAVHDISHPGTRASVRLMTERFVWADIERETREFVRNCLACQRAKVGRHTKSPLTPYPATQDSDIQASPAELVYGTTLTIPAEFFSREPQPVLADQSDFARTLRDAMSKIRSPDTAWHTNRTAFVHHDLNKCTHVFVRNDTVRPALTTPYHCPYKVFTRNLKSFQILLNGRPSLISVDRLKPAYTIDETPPQPTSHKHA
uniref:Integrase_H2C2 domain-containing protein n=1 Tax=Anopheles funestus TaxID=62324 RepID=A0A182RV18_ANOFN